MSELWILYVREGGEWEPIGTVDPDPFAPAFPVRRAGPGEVLERIDDTLEDWERWADAARWRPGHDEGTTAIEYGLFVAFLAAVIIAVVFGLGPALAGAFDKGCDAVTGRADRHCPTGSGQR